MANLPPLSFEFYPPQTQEGVNKLKHTAKELNKYEPDFFSVTFGAGGSTKERTLDAVFELSNSDFNVAPHISCISSSKVEIKELLDQYKSQKINHLVALRGDNPSGAINSGEFNYANELVRFIKLEMGDAFKIDVAAYPEVHPESESAKQDFINFKNKVEAGADSAITQFFFNVDAYFKFIEECQKSSINIPIVPGIMPIYNSKQLIRFANNCGAEIPRWLRFKLEDYADDLDSLREFGVDFISELSETLIQNGVPGIHFYTINYSKTLSKIIKNISQS